MTPVTKIKKIKKHPGNVIVMGESKDIYIVNVYKMIAFKHLQYDLDGGCTLAKFSHK